MEILFWGLTISVFGKALLAIGVLRAHGELVHERKIDNVVIRSFRIERWLTIVGLALIVLGYTLEIVFYGFTPFMECGFEECSASALSAFSR